MKSNVTDSQSQICVGLDIGTTKIATVVGFRNEDGKVEILGYGKTESTGVRHGMIQNLQKTVECIRRSMDIASERADVDIKSVYVGVAGRHVESTEYAHSITRKNGRETIITQEEIDVMTQSFQNMPLPPEKQIIEIIPYDFQLDGVATDDPVGCTCDRLSGKFQLVCGNEIELKKIFRCVEDAGLNLCELTLEPLASGLSCLSDTERERGCVLVDIGGGTTDVAIYYKGNLVYTEVIPFGGNSITTDIANVCRVTPQIAETLKVKYGTCIEEKSNSNSKITIPQYAGNSTQEISEPFLARIINARVQQHILKNVKEIIEHCPYSQQLLSGVVLTGGGAMLRHIVELFQYELSLPVRVGRPEFGFVATMPNELKSPVFATALGLLKFGIECESETQTENTNVVEDKERTDLPKKDKPTIKIFGWRLGKKFKDIVVGLLSDQFEETE